jgi:hypothetical protein
MVAWKRESEALEVAWKRESEALKYVMSLLTAKRNLESWNGKDEPCVCFFSFFFLYETRAHSPERLFMEKTNPYTCEIIFTWQILSSKKIKEKYIFLFV